MEDGIRLLTGMERVVDAVRKVQASGAVLTMVVSPGHMNARQGSLGHMTARQRVRHHHRPARFTMLPILLYKATTTLVPVMAVMMQELRVTMIGNHIIVNPPEVLQDQPIGMINVVVRPNVPKRTLRNLVDLTT